MSQNNLTENELRQQYTDRTCECGSYISRYHVCFDGPKAAMSFVQWITYMTLEYPKLGWMKRK